MTDVVEFFNSDRSYAGKRVGDRIFNKWDGPILNVIGDELRIIETGELVGFLEQDTVLDHLNKAVASAEWKVKP